MNKYFTYDFLNDAIFNYIGKNYGVLMLINKNIYNNYLIKFEQLQTSKKNLKKLIKDGNIEKCLWIINSGYPLEQQDKRRITYHVTRYGKLEILKLLVQNNIACFEHWHFLNIACRNGHLNILQWAKENNFIFNWNQCYVAAYNNQFEILKWLRSINTPWNWNITHACVQNNNLELLKWCYSNGCELDWNTFEVAKSMNNNSIINFLTKNNCPMNSFYNKA